MTVAAIALEESGGIVRLRTPARELQVVANAVVGVAVESGDALHADYYIAAVPHDILLDLLPAEAVARSRHSQTWPTFAARPSPACISGSTVR